jgi:hypothetical protein
MQQARHSAQTVRRATVKRYVSEHGCCMQSTAVISVKFYESNAKNYSTINNAPSAVVGGWTATTKGRLPRSPRHCPLVRLIGYLTARRSTRGATFPPRQGKGRRPAARTRERRTAWGRCLGGGQSAAGWAGRGGSGTRLAGPPLSQRTKNPPARSSSQSAVQAQEVGSVCCCLACF